MCGKNRLEAAHLKPIEPVWGPGSNSGSRSCTLLLEHLDDDDDEEDYCHRYDAADGLPDS